MFHHHSCKVIWLQLHRRRNENNKSASLSSQVRRRLPASADLSRRSQYYDDEAARCARVPAFGGWRKSSACTSFDRRSFVTNESLPQSMLCFLHCKAHEMREFLPGQEGSTSRSEQRMPPARLQEVSRSEVWAPSSSPAARQRASFLLKKPIYFITPKGECSTLSLKREKSRAS